MENNNIGQVASAPVQAQPVTVVKNNFWKGFFVGVFSVLAIGVLWVVLTAFVLVSGVNSSLGEARAKGAEASVKANLANTRAQAEIYFDGTGSYANVCESDPVVSATLASLKSQAYVSGVACFADAKGYVVTAGVKGTEGAISTSCVDSTGASKTVAGYQPATSATYRCQ